MIIPEMKDFAPFEKEVIEIMLGYGVSIPEAILYLKNDIELKNGSKELQQCVKDLDPIQYQREMYEGFKWKGIFDNK